MDLKQDLFYQTQTYLKVEKCNVFNQYMLAWTTDYNEYVILRDNLPFKF